jgi:hypothetical protein
MADFRGCFEYTPRTKFDLCPKIGGSCFHPFSPFFRPLFGGSFVFYKIRLFVCAALSIFAYNIYQTGLKRQDDASVKIVLHELWLIYKQYYY